MLCVCTAVFGLFSLSLPLRSRSSLVVGPRGPTRCVVTIVCLCTCQFTMYTTETAFGILTTCCGLYFSSLTSHCRLTCIGCLVHSLPPSVLAVEIDTKAVFDKKNNSGLQVRNVSYGSSTNCYIICYPLAASYFSCPGKISLYVKWQTKQISC